jgi:hypothetical protein
VIDIVLSVLTWRWSAHRSSLVYLLAVTGTWWFAPEEANSYCSSAVTDSFVRTTTYSFGSVCFGSFLVALVQALRALEYYSRDNDELQFLSCIIQCILSCIQSIIEEFTKFAYVSLVEASENRAGLPIISPS